jgi:hypothetical protein
MTQLHLRCDVAHDPTRAFPVWRIFKRIATVFAVLHRSIVRAKLRHRHGGMLFEKDCGEMLSLEPQQDTGKFPQRPLVLGDKWDF